MYRGIEEPGIANLLVEEKVDTGAMLAVIKVGCSKMGKRVRFDMGERLVETLTAWSENVLQQLRLLKDIHMAYVMVERATVLVEFSPDLAIRTCLDCKVVFSREVDSRREMDT